MTNKLITQLIKPLITAGVYKNEIIALKDIIADYVNKKIDYYYKIIGQNEKKHGEDFMLFSKKIKGKATFKNEDDWMEWKSSITMRDSWSQALKGILKDAV
mgnify:CR=1 FL=1